MKNESISKKTILKSIAKMVTDKEFVRSYIKGKTPVPTSNAIFRPLKKFKIAHGNRLQSY